MKKIFLVFCLCALLAGTSAGQSAKDKSKKYAVIVHGENPIDKLTGKQVRSYYLREKQTWPDGEKILLYAYGERDKSMIGFCKHIIKMSLSDLTRHWLRQRIQKGLKPPSQSRSSSQMVKRISKKKFSIGFVPLDVAKKAKAKLNIKIVFEGSS
jgi:ABC-type phosphate transport system substrate-binding protein